MRRRIDHGGKVGQVVTDEECIVGCQYPLVKHGKRGFQVRRARGDEHERALLWITHQLPGPVGKILQLGFSMTAQGGQRQTYSGKACTLKKQPTIESGGLIR
ncbi:hypothetical protein D9M73_211870 [compost metagenome]